MATYNGHPSRNYWNVSLWVGNDEELYRLALECIKHAPNRKAASEQMLETLNACGVFKTPDGAPYTRASLQHAMRGL